MKRILNNNFVKSLSTIALSVSLLFISGCSDDDPVKEDVPELITKVTLTFTPTDGSAPVIVSATDPDGEGVQDIAPDAAITLAVNKTYILSLQLINGLAAETDPAYNVTEEVEEEGIEHMFFFAWINDVFSDPAGNGNVDNRNDAVNYTGGTTSKDVNDLPLGLTTTWTSATTAAEGTFRVLLKHQPDLKSATSDSNTGETDLDVSFVIKIQE